MSPTDHVAFKANEDKEEDEKQTFMELISDTFKTVDQRQTIVNAYPFFIGSILLFIVITIFGSFLFALGFGIGLIILTSIMVSVRLGYNKLKSWSESGERKRGW